MLTNKQANEIQAMKPGITRKFINKFDEEWTKAVKRVKASGARLWAMPIVSGNVEYKNVRT